MSDGRLYSSASRVNLSCEWCDDDQPPLVLDEAEIRQRVAWFDCRSVILTWREPSLHDLIRYSTPCGVRCEMDR